MSEGRFDGKSAAPGAMEKKGGPARKKIFTVVVILLILGSALAVAGYIKKSAPKPQRRPPLRSEPLVQAETVHKSFEQVVISAMGTVVPVREVEIEAQVSGLVVDMHPDFVPGGRFEAGKEFLFIEPTDYQLAISRAEASVAEADYALKLEQGQQDVARREWELFAGGAPASELDEELALRKPHLLKAQADLNAAQAELLQARINLERTLLRAPFNAMVRSKKVDLGGLLSSQDQVATLVWTDEYWVQAAVPVDRLQWIDFPGGASPDGSLVRLICGAGTESQYERTGTVVRLLGDLEEEGRMAKVLVSVKDPLELSKPEQERRPLLLGEYVRVEIEGRLIDDVVAIPRSAVHDGDRVWTVDSDSRLAFREVQIVWRDGERVYVGGGLGAGERLVLSDLTMPIPGMPLRLDSSAEVALADASLAAGEE